MSELQPVRGFIIDDEEYKRRQIEDAFTAQGGLVVVTAAEVYDIVDLCGAGEITPDKVDVAFIDSEFGSGTGRGGGKEVLRYMFMQGVARSPIGENIYSEEVIPTADKIVTVGSSSDPKWASEIGSYSDRLQQSLIVDWETRPLDLAEVILEVRRLKPIAE